jgi:hypothetical protein
MNEEKVNHPAHYGGDTTYEVIKVMHQMPVAWKVCVPDPLATTTEAGTVTPGDVVSLEESVTVVAAVKLELNVTEHVNTSPGSS